jgi:parvulin-like peptidyl-prolyl isomerase
MKSIWPHVFSPSRRVVLGIAVLGSATLLTGCANSTGGSAAALEIDGKTVVTKSQLKDQLALYSSNEMFMRGVNQPVIAKGTTRYPADLTASILDRRLFVAVIEAATTSLKLKPGPDTPALTEGAARLAFSLQQPDPAAEAEFAKLPKADQELFKDAQRGLDSLNSWIDVELNAEVAKLAGTPQEFYEKNKAQFPDTSCVRHVLVADKAAADKIRARLVGGESWTDVAKESIDTGSGANGGELGCAPTDGYVPEFKAAADSAKIGEITQPVQSQFGFHVLEVTKREESAFNEEQVKQAMQQQFGQQAQQTLAPRLFGPMNKLRVVVSPEFGALQSGGAAGFPTIVSPAAAKAAAAASGQGRVPEAETAPQQP